MLHVYIAFLYGHIYHYRWNKQKSLIPCCLSIKFNHFRYNCMRWSIYIVYLQHFFTSTVFQNCSIPLMSSNWYFVLTSLQLMPKIFNGVYSQGIREVNVQPNEEWHLKIIVANEIWYPFLARRVRGWTAVVSSLATICMSTIFLISAIIFDGLPEPGRLQMNCKEL